MARAVDHDARRLAIVESMLRIASRDGLAAATSRAIAADLGLAKGALWYYFDDFDAVVQAAHTLSFERANERVQAATAGKRGLPAILAMMEELLPLTEETQAEARIVVNFWGHAAANDRLARNDAGVESVWHEQLLGHLAEAVDDGELDPNAPLGLIVDALMTITFGQQVISVTADMMAAPYDPMALVDFVLGKALIRR